MFFFYTGSGKTVPSFDQFDISYLLAVVYIIKQLDQVSKVIRHIALLLSSLLRSVIGLKNLALLRVITTLKRKSFYCWFDFSSELTGVLNRAPLD